MSIAVDYDITIDQGSDFALSIVLQEEDGSFQDLTGYSARAQMRRTKSDPDIAATFSCSIPAPLEGQITLALPNSITEGLTPSVEIGSEYYYDVEIFTAGNASVLRVLQGRALVTEQVTK